MQQEGSLAEALQRAHQLLARDPPRAERQADAILDALPDHPEALLIQGAARARQGNTAGAHAILEPLSRAQPGAAVVQREWGRLLADLGQTDRAIAALTQAARLQPGLPGTWRPLADLLFLAGRGIEADAAYARHLRLSVHDPALMAAGDALNTGDLPTAERLLRAILRQHPSDIGALRMLAEVATRLGRYPAAETLLTQCLELAPNFAGARHNLAVVLYRQNRAIEALPHMERLAAEQPAQPNYANLLAAALASTGATDRAIAIYRSLTTRFPQQARLWLGLGHALRTAGRRADAIAAYRAALTLAPTMGETWWSLANLKSGVLTQPDIAAMKAALTAANLTTEDRYHLHYALGRTLQEAADYAASFAQYQQGARLRRQDISYDADATTAQIDRSIALLTPAFLAARAGSGCPDPAPIFILGLPRSGSTLLEQMLSCHPDVEGIMELPEMANIARDLAAGQTYPDCLEGVPPDRLAGWGQRYLDRVRSYRRTGRPLFIDKMPNNWVHAGLIRLILPQAKIIDARRHPMATCLSAWQQHFARGQHYSYDFAELGRYYVDYTRLMAHLHQVQPGRIHTVQYEAMVTQTEPQLRRLLAFCGLDYHPACLDFHANPRSVRTASSEQVRRPIFRDGLDHWRHYEAWLAPLADALAPCLTAGAGIPCSPARSHTR